MKSSAPIILAIETATDACSVALCVDNRFYTREEIGERIHTQRLIPMIQDMLNEANCQLSELTALAVGKGPGSFTGVRIAVGLVQGLGFGLNCLIYPVSTLAALAQQAVFLNLCDENTLILPMLDARMSEIYVGGYGCIDGNIGNVIEEKILNPADICNYIDNKNVLKHSNSLNIKENKYDDKKYIYLGSGCDRYNNEMQLQEDISEYNKNIIKINNIYPRAQEVLHIALNQYQHGIKGISALEITPTYLRDKIA